MISIRRSRTVVLPLLLFILICLAFKSHLQWLPHPFAPTTNGTSADDVPSSPFHPGLVDFWDATSGSLLESKPSCSLPTDPIEAPLHEFASLKKNVDNRPDLLKIPQQDVDELRDAHARFVGQIPELAQKLPYANGMQGIAVAASGALLPEFLVSLKMLRRTGSILPVQVFIETKAQYEKEICEIVLPPMNATCMILSEILEAVPQKLEMSKYQLKSLALAFSSFDDVLLLDADNIPVEQPEHLLNSEPFSSKGFVSWPDYWANTASPLFYKITQQPVPSTSTRAASEAGQLLLSKAKHAPTLLLSLYYNYHGPTHYYKLLSQSPALNPNFNSRRSYKPNGEAEKQPAPKPETGTDKETYLAAAIRLNSTYHTVTTPIFTLGFTESHTNLFKPAALTQHNPTADYNLHLNSKNKSTLHPHPSFLHSPIYPLSALLLPPLFENSIRHQRMWGSAPSLVARFGRDVEKQVWAEVLYTGCHLRGAFGAWRNETDVCKRIGRVYRFLFN